MQRRLISSAAFSAVAGLLSWLLPALAVEAHPHVFIEARSEMVFDKEGRLTDIRHVWRFDEAFTAFAIQGLDADGDGKLSDAELHPLAKINVESLKEYDFFTFLRVGKTKANFADPTEYWLDFSDGRLTLFYTLSLTKPLAVAAAQTTLEVYDPTYFIDFKMTEKDPFVLVGAPDHCGLTVEFAAEPNAVIAAQLAQIPADVRDIPDQFKAVTSTLSNEARLECP